MSAVRPLKAGTPPKQVESTDTLTVNNVDSMSAGTLAIGAATATEVDISNSSATVKIKGNLTQSILTNTNNSVDLGSTTHGWRDVYLYDGTDARALSDTTLSAPGAELVGVNASEFIAIAPAGNTVYDALKAADSSINTIISGGTGVLDNFAAVAAPTITDDLSAGYSIGSRWLIVNTGPEYVCVDDSVGAAVWVELGSSDLTSVALFDDFADDGVDWVVSTSNDGTAKLSPSGTPLGFPSRGIAMLKADTTASSKATIVRKNAGFVLGASTPITMTASYAGPFNGVGAYSDDECQWYIALSDETGANLVALFAMWSGGLRSYVLATFVGGVLTAEPITMPAITLYAAVRLTITETGTLVEVAPDGGAFSTVLTGVTAPAQVVYSSTIQVSKDTGAGDRTLAIDYVMVNGSRTAMDSGATIPTESDFGSTDILAFFAANTTNVDFNNVKLTNVADPVAFQEVATRASSESAATAAAQSFANINTALGAASADVSVNNQKITNVAAPVNPPDAATKDYVDTGDGILATAVSGKAAVGSGIVAVGTANSDGASGTAARVDHVHAHGAQTDDTMHAVATKSAGGFVDKDTWDEDLGASQKWVRFYRDTFGTGILAWTPATSGTGALVAASTPGGTTPSQPGARVYCGTTATGFAVIRPGTAYFYDTPWERVFNEAVVRLGSVPSVIAPADDYIAQVAFIATYTGGVISTGGIGFRATSASANWQATTWSGGTPTDYDTGIAVDTDLHRFRCELVTGVSVTWYIDGVQVKQITSSIPTLSALFPIPMMATGVAYTSATTRDIRCVFAHAAGKLAADRP